MIVLPPRRWPNELWVATAALGLLVLHAVALGVELMVVEANGGLPATQFVLGAELAPAVEVYSTQVMGGFVPALAFLGVGMYAAIRAARAKDEDIAWWGRAFVIAFAVVSGALLLLGYPWYEVLR